LVNAIIVKAPQNYDSLDGVRIFLQGSIEQGLAGDWRKKVISAISDLDVVILNPIRDDWDESWQQTEDSIRFRSQVEWQLKAQQEADIIVSYLDPKTKSPITLMEIGLFANDKLIVCCPEGFYKKGDVDVVCEWYGIKQVATLDELILAARTRVAEFYSEGKE
jgi:hypothetical protein